METGEQVDVGAMQTLQPLLGGGLNLGMAGRVELRLFLSLGLGWSVLHVHLREDC